MIEHYCTGRVTDTAHLHMTSNQFQNTRRKPNQTNSHRMQTMVQAMTPHVYKCGWPCWAKCLHGRMVTNSDRPIMTKIPSDPRRVSWALDANCTTNSLFVPAAIFSDSHFAPNFYPNGRPSFAPSGAEFQSTPQCRQGESMRTIPSSYGATQAWLIERTKERLIRYLSQMKLIPSKHSIFRRLRSHKRLKCPKRRSRRRSGV